jgi:putative transposase
MVIVFGVLRLVGTLVQLLGAALRSRSALAAENLFLRRPPGGPRGDQRWATFLCNHAKAIIACDFFVAVTATFQLVYVLVVIEHGSRKLTHFNVTGNPSTDWTGN